MQKMKAPDLSHLEDFYQMKPGAVIALRYSIENAISEDVRRGMDQKIVGMFAEGGKPLTSVETLEDIVKSLPTSSATVEDLKDDFLALDYHGSLPESIEQLNDSFKESMKEKRLSNESSLSQRNLLWMKKYNNLTQIHENCLAIHGALHFPGQNGILNLGQEEGWKWSIFNHSSQIYTPFTYKP